MIKKISRVINSEKRKRDSDQFCRRERIDLCFDGHFYHGLQRLINKTGGNMGQKKCIETVIKLDSGCEDEQELKFILEEITHSESRNIKDNYTYVGSESKMCKTYIQAEIH